MAERTFLRGGLGKRIAIAAFAALLTTCAPGGVGERTQVNAAQGSIDCTPDPGSPAKGSLVKLDQDILKRHNLTVDQAINQAVLCSKGGEPTTILLASGSYPYGNAIRLGSDVALKGEGPDTKLIYNNPVSDDDEAIGVPGGKGNFKNITVEDLELKGPGAIEQEIDGFQLRGADGWTISRVKVSEFSRDGFHLSFNSDSGVNSSVISDSESSRNGRNGISITHGSNNIIQRSTFSGNSLSRPGIYGVAGISLEPDSSNRVSNNIVRWNIVKDNKHHGIGLATENTKKGSNFGNVMCENTLAGNHAGPFSELTENSTIANLYSKNSPQPNRRDVKSNSDISSKAAAECQ